VVVPTVAWAVLTSATAVAVNLATEWKSNPWAWLAVAVTTALVASVALWLDRRQAAAGSSENGGGQSVSHSTIGQDNIQIGRARDVNLEHRRDPKK
jgi:hypothetical protein